MTTTQMEAQISPTPSTEAAAFGNHRRRGKTKSYLSERERSKLYKALGDYADASSDIGENEIEETSAEGNESHEKPGGEELCESSLSSEEGADNFCPGTSRLFWSSSEERPAHRRWANGESVMGFVSEGR